MQFAGNGGLEVIFVFFDLSLSISLKIILITQNFGNTVKHAYSQHAYNELMPLLKWFLFPVGFKHIEKLTDLTNYIYDDAKSPVPGTSL